MALLTRFHDLAIAHSTMNIEDGPTMRPQPSFICHLLRITDMAEDRMRWDLDWEKVFKILKDPMKVYRLLLQGRPMLGEMDKEAIDTYCAALREAQKTAFVCARCFRAPEFKLDKLWQLWDDDKRLQHMFAGLEFACESSPLSQDARVLCPEVSISHLLRDRGEAFVDLVRKFITSAGQTPPYALPFPFPDPWWQQLAREFPKPQPEAYIAMTLIRQEFIGEPLICIASICCEAGRIADAVFIPS